MPVESAAHAVTSLKTEPGSNWSVTARFFWFCTGHACGLLGSNRGQLAMARMSPVHGILDDDRAALRLVVVDGPLELHLGDALEVHVDREDRGRSVARLDLRARRGGHPAPHAVEEVADPHVGAGKLGVELALDAGDPLAVEVRHADDVAADLAERVHALVLLVEPDPGSFISSSARASAGVT